MGGEKRFLPCYMGMRLFLFDASTYYFPNDGTYGLLHPGLWHTLPQAYGILHPGLWPIQRTATTQVMPIPPQG